MAEARSLWCGNSSTMIVPTRRPPLREWRCACRTVRIATRLGRADAIRCRRRFLSAAAQHSDLLTKLHCDGNILFRCATGIGITSDVFDLAAGGTVDPEVIVERGEGSPARSMWLALAAQAAFARA